MLMRMNQEILNEAGDQRDLNHQTYLLRLWRAELGQPAVWRASLENTQTGERFGFAMLEQLFVFLMEQVEGADQATRGSLESRRSTTDEE
jgi:hypothetical protein